MRWIGAIVAVALIVAIFVDAFESVVLPRRIKHGYRLARLYYQSAWCLWRATAIGYRRLLKNWEAVPCRSLRKLGNSTIYT